MTTYMITFWDQRDRPHTAEVEADSVEAAIAAIEEDLKQQIQVKKIDIVDEENA